MIYTVVWVMIWSLMSFTAPEGRFLEGLPENGQPYKNWSDLARGFVKYQHCIGDLQQKLQRNTWDIQLKTELVLLLLLLSITFVVNPLGPLGTSWTFWYLLDLYVPLGP